MSKIKSGLATFTSSNAESECGAADFMSLSPSPCRRLAVNRHQPDVLRKRKQRARGVWEAWLVCRAPWVWQLQLCTRFIPSSPPANCFLLLPLDPPGPFSQLRDSSHCDLRSCPRRTGAHPSPANNSTLPPDLLPYFWGRYLKQEGSIIVLWWCPFTCW